MTKTEVRKMLDNWLDEHGLILSYELNFRCEKKGEYLNCVLEWKDEKSNELESSFRVRLKDYTNVRLPDDVPDEIMADKVVKLFGKIIPLYQARTPSTD